MLAPALAVGVVLYAFVHFLAWPTFLYLQDRKGLRRYPNYSFCASISDWPLCLLSSTGSRSRTIATAHKERDAKVLRIGPNNLSFAHKDAIRDIYGHSTTCIKDLKYKITAAPHPNIFDVTDKHEHSVQRKRLSAAFAIKNLVRWEHKVARMTERLIAALDRQCTPQPKDVDNLELEDANVDYNYWINLFTIDAINYLTLSSELNCLERGNDIVTAQRPDGTRYECSYRKCQDNTAFALSHFCWDYQHLFGLMWLSKLFPGWRRVWNDAAPWSDMVNYQSLTRLARYENREDLDDFFTALMEDKTGKPHNLAWPQVVSDVGAIINAGADTTSIALTQVLYFLIRHPEHLATLRKEVDEALDTTDVVAPYDRVKQLPFLKACLDEGMRFIPPVSSGLPRRTPPEGAQIMGEWIAGDTSVSMTTYFAHHDPTVFPNPDEFNPHRWMWPEERKRMEPYFIPFSTGGRGCIGRNISYLEQTVVLASLVHRYEFALPREFELARFEAFNLIMGKMPIKIWRRAEVEHA